MLKKKDAAKGFSLIEVVLAIGVLSLAVLALIGLFGPTMASVKQVVDTNQATSIMSMVNAELQANRSFQEVYDWANQGQFAYVWNEQIGVTSNGSSDLIDIIRTRFQPHGSGGTVTYDGLIRNNIERLVGVPFLVALGRPEMDYDWADGLNTEGYVPVHVSIYSFDAIELEEFSRSLPTFSGGKVPQDQMGGKLLISYTTAKTR